MINWTDILDAEIASGLWAIGQMLSKPRASHRTTVSMNTAAWADTGRLVKPTVPWVRRELPNLSDTEAANLEKALKRHEVQGAVQALLAARLTDAPEADSNRAREAVVVALCGLQGLNASSHGSPTMSIMVDNRVAILLSEYLDDRISELVVKLEAEIGFAGLEQIRAEAFNSRIVALLGTLVTLVEALGDPDRNTKNETQFLEQYRRQVRERHGKIEPPDFERRRRIPMHDIYVPTVMTKELSEMELSSQDAQPSQQSILNLSRLIDRTVLLGDPGGGKTTAANVLVDKYASDEAHRVPFLVTLRDYAANDTIPWSIKNYIEYNLQTLYQSPAPRGLVERLLYTGRAAVIFDGLDELLDTSRRRNVSQRVEQFCAAYPLAPVLVTSRVIGYDQARLDDTQFTCYRLGGFEAEDVGTYVRKWFESQENTSPAEAEAESGAFLSESSSAADLRSNPLLLSLMCILYRGAGSLPRDKAGIYASCAKLLFGKWDEQRHIHRNLRAADFVEPAIRHLAWWLFESKDPQAAVTEKQLIAKVTDFLHKRAFESRSAARSAAEEFVKFCNDRMWVFSDAGTTETGQKLYAFTHRTFLEYFSAAYLAATSDSPEDLAQMLAPRLAAGQWDVVSELAIQIKNDDIDLGADRIYKRLIELAKDSTEQVQLLRFLSLYLDSARPSYPIVRLLTRALIDYAGFYSPERNPLILAIQSSSSYYKRLIVDEMTERIVELAQQDYAGMKTPFDGFRIAGMFFRSDQKMPLVHRNGHQATPGLGSLLALAQAGHLQNEDAQLGLATVIAIATEISDKPSQRPFIVTELKIPSNYRQIFLNWAKAKVDFVQFAR